MDVLLNKLKKSNKFALISFILVFLAYMISLIFFTKSLLSLEGIETVLRIIGLGVFFVWLFFYGLMGLVTLVKKKRNSFIAITIISLVLSILFSVGAFLIDSIYGKLTNVNNKYVTYTSYMIDLIDDKFETDSKIGMIDDEKDLEGHILANKLIKKNSLNNEITHYEDYYEMIHDLYEGKIDAIFVSSNYIAFFSSEELYENISTETKVVYEYSEEMENQDNMLASNKELTEPFTVLLMGVDSAVDGLTANQAFNGDTLMLITFNPTTMTSTMFSMPRDLYVPIACRNGASAKINSSAAYGTSCVINTVQDLTGIEIDYYAKINFKGVVDLVDSLNGIEVDVQKPDYNTYNGQVCEQDSLRRKGSHLICMDTGIQTLNGEQALAYSRCRKLYIRSDIDRNRHQQQVIEAIINKAKNINSFGEVEKVLDAISNNIETNMDMAKLLSFYNVGKQLLLNSNNTLTIQKTYLEYYSLPVYLPGSGQVTSALGYYEASLAAIVSALKVNLELEEAELIKSTSFSYKEDYTTSIIGKGITDNSKKEVVPNFRGKSVSYMESWAAARNITVNFITAEYGTNNYNSNYGAGVISAQSVPYGTFVSNVSSITIYLNGSYSGGNNKPNTEQTVPEIDQELENSGILPME